MSPWKFESSRPHHLFFRSQVAHPGETRRETWVPHPALRPARTSRKIRSISAALGTDRDGGGRRTGARPPFRGTLGLVRVDGAALTGAHQSPFRRYPCAGPFRRASRGRCSASAEESIRRGRTATCAPPRPSPSPAGPGRRPASASTGWLTLKWMLPVGRTWPNGHGPRQSGGKPLFDPSPAPGPGTPALAETGTRHVVLDPIRPRRAGEPLRSPRGMNQRLSRCGPLYPAITASVTSPASNAAPRHGPSSWSRSGASADRAYVNLRISTYQGLPSERGSSGALHVA